MVTLAQLGDTIWPHHIHGDTRGAVWGTTFSVCFHQLLVFFFMKVEMTLGGTYLPVQGTTARANIYEWGSIYPDTPYHGTCMIAGRVYPWCRDRCLTWSCMLM